MKSLIVSIMIMASSLGFTQEVNSLNENQNKESALGTQIQKDKKELKEAKEVLLKDQAQVNQDKEKLKLDKKNGAPAAEIKADKEQLKKDRHTRNEAQRKVREERKELNKDRHARNDEQNPGQRQNKQFKKRRHNH